MNSNAAERKQQTLSASQRAAIMKILDRKAGFVARLFAVFEPHASERDAPLQVAAWRFGASLILVGIFFLGFCFFLPSDDRRWMLIGMACLVVLVGVRFVDRANKKLRCTTKQKSN